MYIHVDIYIYIYVDTWYKKGKKKKRELRKDMIKVVENLYTLIIDNCTRCGKLRVLTVRKYEYCGIKDLSIIMPLKY